MKNQSKIHIAIQAKDFEQVVNFYIQLFNMYQSYSWSIPEFDIKQAVMLKSNDVDFLLEVFDAEANIAMEGRKAKKGEEVVSGALLHYAIHTSKELVTYYYNKALSLGAMSIIAPDVVFLDKNNNIQVYNALVQTKNGEVLEFIAEDVFE